MATGHRRGGKNPLAYLGVDPIAPTPLFIQKRSPLTSDLAGYTVGSMWVVTSPQEVWILTSKAGGIATWIQMYPGAGGGASSFPCDTGTANEAGGVLNINGDIAGNITTLGSGNDVDIILNDTITIPGNFVSTAGQVIVDGDITSSNGGLTVHDRGIFGLDVVAATFDTQQTYLFTNGHSVNGVLSTNQAFASDVVVGLGYGTAGQVLVGVDGTEAGPTWANITSTGGSIAITNGAGTINLESNALPIGGTDGQILVGATAGSAAWTDLTSDGTLVVSGGANTLDVSLSHGTNGELLIGSTGVAPVWNELTSSDGSITIVNGAGSIDLTTVGGGGSSIAFSAYFGSDTTINTGEYFGAVTAPLIETFDKGNCFYPGDGAGAPATFTAPSDGVYAFGGYIINNSENIYVIETPTESITAYRVACAYPGTGGPYYQRKQDIYTIELSAGDIVKWKCNSGGADTIFNNLRGDKCSNIFGFQINKVTTGIGGNAYSFKAIIPRSASAKWATYNTDGYLGDKGSALTEIYDTGNCFYPGDGAGNGCSYTAPVDGIYSFSGKLNYGDHLTISVSDPNNPTDYSNRFYTETFFPEADTYTFQLNAGDVIKWNIKDTNTAVDSFIYYSSLLVGTGGQHTYFISGYLIEAI